LKLLFGGWF